jgi:hypothetical protein
MSAPTPAERRTNASIAANIRWSQEKNRSLATAKARANGPGSIEYWMRRVDPEGEMTYADRVKAAENAKKAFYGQQLKAARKAKARRKGEA